MPTYLISLGTNDFSYEEASSSTSNGVIHRTWTRTDYIDAGYAVYAVNEVEPPLLQYYEDTFGYPFPISKMDQIAYPSYGGAMENWGLIVYAEDLLVWDEVLSGAREQESAAAVIAHENAHNFFGDLVTCQWWDAIWLNEGFAEYVHFLGVDAVHPEFNYWDFFYYYEFQYVLKYDGTTQSHPTIREVPTASDADFGSITYDRGSSINRYLSSVLTRDTFIEGLNTYLEDHAFGNTQYDDLWEPLNEIGHSQGTLADEYEIKEIMESFMVQMNYPLLTVNYDPATGVASLSQSRFLYDPENADPDDDYRWYVPISYTFVGDSSTDFGNSGAPGTFEGPAHNTLFMRPEETTLDVDIGASDLPVVFNLQASAFMRVNYDSDNWEKIINQLEADYLSFDQASRGALLNDAFALAEAGIEGYDLPLDVAQYLVNEDSYNVIGIAYDILQDLIDSSNSDVSAMALSDFLESIIAVNYDTVGIDENTSNAHDQNQFQRIIHSAANYLQLAQFDNDAGDVFSTWMDASDPDDPVQNPVNRHTKRYVYCAAARELGSIASDFMEERLTNALLPQVRFNLFIKLLIVYVYEELLKNFSSLTQFKSLEWFEGWYICKM